MLAYLRKSEKLAELTGGFGSAPPPPADTYQRRCPAGDPVSPKLRRALAAPKQAGPVYVVIDGTSIRHRPRPRGPALLVRQASYADTTLQDTLVPAALPGVAIPATMQDHAPMNILRHPWIARDPAFPSKKAANGSG
jgi:hypothetical protein